MHVNVRHYHHFFHFFSWVGAKKLKLDAVDLKVFLEDGFEVDEDDILMSSMTENQVLILATESPNTNIKGK